MINYKDFGGTQRGFTVNAICLLTANVNKIVCSKNSFAALKITGKVIVWGDPNFGGDMSKEIREQLFDIVDIEATSEGAGFIAHRRDDEKISW